MEAIAYGDDADLRPADRLRALELLREYQDHDDLNTLFRREVDRMDETAAVAHLDALLACEFLHGFKSEKYPELGVVLERHVEERVKERTAEPRFRLDPVTN